MMMQHGIRKGDIGYYNACELAWVIFTREALTNYIRGTYPEAVLRGGAQRLVAVPCGTPPYKAETWVIRRFVNGELDHSMVIVHKASELEIHGIMHLMLQEAESEGDDE
jgi:hypothetical protein